MKTGDGGITEGIAIRRPSYVVIYLRAQLCVSPPESYSLDEKRKICEDLDASTAESDAAIFVGGFVVPMRVHIHQ